MEANTLPNGYTIDQGKPGSWLFILMEFTKS